ncbi:hypothetical protein ACE4Z6_27310, partial [Salmonella enterica]|uniref:hypothetical protein n=1 Tax=Salmonella enterica TaxID=28901 RepID=UPI003D269C30
SAWVRVIDMGSLGAATTVSNTSAINDLTTTVNGVTGSAVNIINTNTIAQAGANITSTINGIGATVTPALTGDVSGGLNATSVDKIKGAS